MPVDASFASLVPVRNRQLGPTVFRDPVTDTTIRWEGAGDQRGDDIVQVDTAVFSKPNFQVMIRKGVLAQLSNEEYVQAMSGQAPYPETGDVLQTQADSVIYRPEVNDLIGVPCIGPGSRPGASCTNQVAVRKSDTDSHPPLCDGHKFMEPQYVSTISTDGIKTWSLAVMGDRVVQSPT